MGLLSWLKRNFRSTDRFDPSPAAGRIPEILIRELRTEDIDACHRIYTENAAHGLPDGYFETFTRDIESNSYLWMVAEVEEGPVGVGGICLTSTPDLIGGLAFGLVRPDKQQQGIGSALLLARMAALPKPDRYTRVMMSSVPATVDFYKQFGFSYFGRIPIDETRELDHYYTVVTRPAWGAASVLLASGGVSITPAMPKIPVRQMAES